MVNTTYLKISSFHKKLKHVITCNFKAIEYRCQTIQHLH